MEKPKQFHLFSRKYNEANILLGNKGFKITKDKRIIHVLFNKILRVNNLYYEVKDEYSEFIVVYYTVNKLNKIQTLKIKTMNKEVL